MKLTEKQKELIKYVNDELAEAAKTGRCTEGVLTKNGKPLKNRDLLSYDVENE